MRQYSHLSIDHETLARLTLTYDDGEIGAMIQRHRRIICWWRKKWGIPTSRTVHSTRGNRLYRVNHNFFSRPVRVSKI